MDVAASSMIGQTVSHYQIVGRLGGGGMGMVYDAIDTRLGRHVALKFIPDEMANDRKSLDRFLWEARAASQLNHPGICTIHEIEHHDGHPFMLLERLQGVSLKVRMRAQPLDRAEGPVRGLGTRFRLGFLGRSFRTLINPRLDQGDFGWG